MGIIGRLGIAEEKISELEDKAVRTIQTKTRRGNFKTKVKKSMTEMWDSWQRTDVSIIGVPKWEGGTEKMKK